MRIDSMRMRYSIILLGTVLVAGSVLLAQTPALVGRFTRGYRQCEWRR
jgi:hypothetical protein